jgi:hypothetical protein
MSKEEEEIIQATNSELFEFNIDRFIEELSALNETLPIQLLLLEYKHKQLIKKLEKISTDLNEETNKDGVEVIKYKISSDKIEDFPKIHKHLNRTEIATKIIPRNYIVSIISQYDAFLGDLMRALYTINPNIIRSSEKEINAEDLFIYDTIDELKSHIIDKEVDTLLRESHYEQLLILEKKISTVVKDKKFTLTSNLPILTSFIELTQRRNLFVHTNGFTTKQYLESSKKWKFKTDCQGSVNEELVASPEYCQKAYFTLYEMSVKLTHVLWRKFIPLEREEADEHLNQLIYELLIENNYELAIEMSNFFTDVIRNFHTEHMRKIVIINKAIGYKMLDKNEECKKVIENEDWSIGTEFKLAKLVLEDNYKEAKALMLKIGKNDEIVSKKAYKNWPLFEKFRLSEEFKSGYLELFSEAFMFEEVQEKEHQEIDEELDEDLDALEEE